MHTIAHIENLLPEKFGMPRQSGLAAVPGRIVFEPAYRSAEAVRGLEDYDYLWLLWQFNRTATAGWHPTVRPPRLGGNRRVGVFATRSPFRPNPIGLSSVRLTSVETDNSLGPILHVVGADLVDGTPIYDIKPYLPYTDCHPEARSGFATEGCDRRLEVVCSDRMLQRIEPGIRDLLPELLAQDPRPRYQDDPERRYTMRIGQHEVTFHISRDQLIIDNIE
ncbi:MAG: conserved hypothetical protein TIGR00104 [bacterium P3]|nr:MAG: conserved hypothetical protein TIGR00104 [bacterium P3]KWW42725.1 MAG: conserved hypothetical protein TIGR00104 [bacterium F083]